ncbi:Hypothetical predicted protein [Mytilus galloprovincialis]|uniref:Uncharacterized protein n=1 Tax=Mytilus galloprovincialis TaxID=29158 RepID=A0A8B6H0U1_MYTGA|nr:Hypothetical predicted protein [Mytilus galloprovincialis]
MSEKITVECFDADARFYPCSWVGKTFKVSVDTTTVGSWSFDFTGKGSMLEMLDQVLQLECVKIHGQFIILRKIGTDMMSCMSIYNITEDAFRFYYRHRYVDNPKSVCDVCHDFKPFIARGQIAVSFPNCIYPRNCSDLKPRSAICDDRKEKKIEEGTCDRTPPPMPMMPGMNMGEANSKRGLIRISQSKMAHNKAMSRLMNGRTISMAMEG